MKKIKISSLVMLITFFPLLLPDGLSTIIGIQNKSLLIIRGIDLILLFFLLIRKKQRVSFPFIILSAIYLTILYSSYIHGQMISVLSANFCGLVMCVAFEYWLKNYFMKTVKFLNYTLLFLIALNIVLIIIFPNGLYDSTYQFTSVTIADHLTYNSNWLFGYKNNQLGIVLPFLALTCIYKFCKSNKLKISSAFIFLFCILGEFLSHATMSTILLLVLMFSIFTIFDKNNKLSLFIKKFYNIKTIIIVVVVCVVCLIRLNTSGLISNVLTEISLALGKGTTFNGRTSIWKVAIDFIKESPFIGYGSINSEIFIEQSKILGGTHAHNFILHILISGGIVCLAEYIVLYCFIIKFLRKNRCIISDIMGLVIGLFFVDGITSICIYYPLFNSIFILSYYVVDYYIKHFGRGN